MTARGLFLAALVTALGGCSGVPVTTHAEVDSTVTLSAVVLCPVRATGGGDTAALGDRVTAVTLQAVAGQALVWAGREVQLLHPERRDWTATSAVPLLRAAGVRPEDAVVLQPRVETAQSSSQQEVRGGGTAAVGAAEELRWRATVEILQPSTGRVLVETSAEARTDPFAGGGTDAAASQPGAVLEHATTEALAQLAGRWTPPRPPRGPVLESWTVVSVDDGHLGRGLDAEVQRLERLQTANPGLDESEAARLARLPPGVLIRRAPLGFRLQPQDLVLSIDAIPANAAALARARFGTSPVALEVRGADGRLRRVKLP
jgi:hypothetical protein